MRGVIVIIKLRFGAMRASAYLTAPFETDCLNTSKLFYGGVNMAVNLT